MEYPFTQIEYIYKLIDPTNNECFWIGRTKNPQNRRNNHRLRKANCGNDKYKERINKIVEAQKRPIFEVVEICPMKKADERENYWIYKLGLNNDLANKSFNGSLINKFKIMDMSQEEKLVVVLKEIIEYQRYFKPNELQKFKFSLCKKYDLSFELIADIGMDNYHSFYEKILLDFCKKQIRFKIQKKSDDGMKYQIQGMNEFTEWLIKFIIEDERTEGVFKNNASAYLDSDPLW